MKQKNLETGFNHFELRAYDRRLSRWMVTDPANQYASPYVGMGNSPIMRVDPDGGFDNWASAFLYKLIHGGSIGRNTDDNTWQVGRFDSEGAFEIVSGRYTGHWDSYAVRSFTPDYINFGFTMQGSGGVTSGANLDFNFLIHGKEKSFRPVVTITTEVGVGSIGGSLNAHLDSGKYTGPLEHLKKSMFETNSKKTDDYSTYISANANVAPILGVGAQVTTTTYNNHLIIHSQVEVSGGLEGGCATGVSNTFIIWQ
ncbi:MAG: hypothetical protein JEZ03_13625 [Bacteroidales bacterium]|nr:hypothetical protein [Bacteroidales bacterium]